jgi:hypothetical protein
VLASNIAKYLRSILIELSFPPRVWLARIDIRATSSRFRRLMIHFKIQRLPSMRYPLRSFLGLPLHCGAHFARFRARLRAYYVPLLVSGHETYRYLLYVPTIWWTKISSTQTTKRCVGFDERESGKPMGEEGTPPLACILAERNERHLALSYPIRIYDGSVTLNHLDLGSAWMKSVSGIVHASGLGLYLLKVETLCLREPCKHLQN